MLVRILKVFRQSPPPTGAIKFKPMVLIRRLKQGEADLYKTIRREALKDSPEAFCATYVAASRRSHESWVEQADGAAEGPDRAIFLAFDSAHPIAMAALYRDGMHGRTGELLQMWVSPDYRGRRIAAELLDAVFEWASYNGFTEVRAAVTRTNQRALGFYLKYGFRREDEQAVGDTVALRAVVEPSNRANIAPLGD